ncbi:MULTISPECIES: acyl carrier protein [Burkholderia cepacia complex]|uniref:acyl carrier protein n=1 Tax=Burkholderia cepacia complex TaxID=87882 RepID=UPI000754828B|nr:MULTISPECIES: acyl carrier protein [Burkholderia cepacia complex]AOI61604.1 phosphopantetheine-binding protein [Burkholderia diffusa]AOI67521.1 phosphopantetheine-binding protein [Burkholderia territorii]KVC49050.1 phosphopantetheine-binding protein [Burkholderia diffusa]KVG25808.1 phosphopantetheine-binding protein [Burkholderia diffusa]KVG57684.1 phosphopantetheine-binding protein [Burkholderia territorii]
MNNADTLSVVLETLASIAPEIDPSTLRTDRPLRSQVDLDSMDWLNFLTGLHARLKVDIPERDYGRLVTLDDIVSYLATAHARRPVS